MKIDVIPPPLNLYNILKEASIITIYQRILRREVIFEMETMKYKFT